MAKYLSWDKKNIFSIFIEQEAAGICDFMYYKATIYPNLCTFMFGGISITIFFDILIAFPNILSNEGFNKYGSIELDCKFYSVPNGGAKNIMSGYMP